MPFPFGPFLTLTISGAISPGPNNIMSMTVGQNFGLKKSTKFILGVICGNTSLLILLTVLYSVVQNLIPMTQQIMKILGSIYLLYMAWLILKNSPTNQSKTTSHLIKEDKLFITGFIFQFINPKAILFGSTIISTYVLPYFHQANTKLFPISIMVSALAVSLFIWSSIGSMINTFLKDYQKPFNIFMAILLVYCAVVISDITSFFIK